MKKQNPKISIIVPVYKAEKYLCKCVDSLLAQTFTDFEVLLIDDGSPDDSGKICDEYSIKDRRSVYFIKRMRELLQLVKWALIMLKANILFMLIQMIG